MSSPKPVECYRCATCGDLFADRDMAEKCCVCPECGKDVPKEDLPKHYRVGAMHRACAKAREARQERERFEKAEKLESWAGPVWYGGRYYADMDALVERLEDELEPSDRWPEWAEACDASPFPKFDFERHVESLSEDFGPIEDEVDPWDHVGPETMALLKRAAAAFDDDMSGVEAWTPNGRFVRIPPAHV